MQCKGCSRTGPYRIPPHSLVVPGSCPALRQRVMHAGVFIVVCGVILLSASHDPTPCLTDTDSCLLGDCCGICLTRVFRPWCQNVVPRRRYQSLSSAHLYQQSISALASSAQKTTGLCTTSLSLAHL